MRSCTYAARLFLLVAVAAYFCGVAPSHRVTQPWPGPVHLAYGQALALSDLDGDNRIDQARLSGSGSDKTIDLILSQNVQPSVLRFSTHSLWHGSLLACDIDNDGDVDLVWTDTVNPDDVVVWVNDGVGRFQQAPSHGWSGGFVIGGDDITGSSGASHDVSVGLGKAPDYNVRTQSRFDAPELADAFTLYCGAQTIAGWALLPSGRAPPLNS